MGATASRVGLGIVTGGLSEVASPLTTNLLRTPTVPEASKTVSVKDKAVQQAMADAAARRSRSRGFRSTILSQLFAPDATALKPTLGG